MLTSSYACQIMLPNNCQKTETTYCSPHKSINTKHTLCSLERMMNASIKESLLTFLITTSLHNSEMFRQSFLFCYFKIMVLVIVWMPGFSRVVWWSYSGHSVPDPLKRLET